MEDLMSKLRQLESKISKQNKINSKQDNQSTKFHIHTVKSLVLKIEFIHKMYVER